MMEQLVPEITTHALSYLDYPSLCRLSMTNSSMRRAANDDNAWKALYHKDFTTEQGTVSPPNGWKSYYAATKAVVDVNADYYNILRANNIVGMSRLWLRADYVKCVHPRGLLLSGYGAVMESWELAFNWNQQYECQLSDVRVRVVGDMAWVTLKEYVNAALEPFLVTNIYEFHNGRWFMVHHHSTPILEAGAADHGMFGG
uniref:F-box domain-containing protein n=1 Tax=Picea sitchensis TaxID=3332 RepID=D5ABI8_PICSI|nr:unknown [Picea sitchensis]